MKALRLCFKFLMVVRSQIGKAAQKSWPTQQHSLKGGKLLISDPSALSRSKKPWCTIRKVIWTLLNFWNAQLLLLMLEDGLILLARFLKYSGTTRMNSLERINHKFQLKSQTLHQYQSSQCNVILTLDLISTTLFASSTVSTLHLVPKCIRESMSSSISVTPRNWLLRSHRRLEDPFKFLTTRFQRPGLWKMPTANLSPVMTTKGWLTLWSLVSGRSKLHTKVLLFTASSWQSNGLTRLP